MRSPASQTTNKQIRFTLGECTLGWLAVAVSEKGVCAIALDDNPEILTITMQKWFVEARSSSDDCDLQQILAKLIDFIEAPHQPLDLPVDISGTAFQQQVWQAIREIPVGATASYSDIARRIGSPKAIRAVAGACAANRLALLIPCHRVVSSGGGLSGYRWGVLRKAELLKREKANAIGSG